MCHFFFIRSGDILKTETQMRILEQHKLRHNRGSQPFIISAITADSGAASLVDH